jgi:hypothetical protein
MKLKTTNELPIQNELLYPGMDFTLPVGLDRYSNAILNFLVESAFYFSSSHNDPHLNGWMTLTSYSSIARSVGCNPRTVQSKIKTMVEKEQLEVVEVYPKDHRTLVSIYRVPYSNLLQ